MIALAAGYQHFADGAPFAEIALRHPSVKEVYFPWIDEPSGRPRLGYEEEDDPAELSAALRRDLERLRAAGVRLDLLLNANCYGEQAMSQALEGHVCEIVGTLHGNDRFTGGDVLAKVVEAFEENSDIDVVFGDVHFENKKGTIVRQYSSAAFTPEKLLIGIAPPHPSLYVRRSVFDRFGFYKEDYLIGADFDMFLRLLYVNKVGYLRLGIDMVAMSLGGLSTQLFHRIVTNNREKYRALRENGVNVSRFALLKRYFYR